jgi:hypothetical protein
MAKNNQNKKGGAAKGLTTVAPGLTGRPSEEYATELNAGRTAGLNASELETGAAGRARKGAGAKKQK